MPSKPVVKLFRVGESDVVIYPLPENLPAGEYRVYYSIYPVKRADDVRAENESERDDCTVKFHCVCDTLLSCDCDTHVDVCACDLHKPTCTCDEKAPPCRCFDKEPPSRQLDM